MKTRFIIFVFLLLANGILAYPFIENDSKVPETDPEELGGFYEGDMDLTEEQLNYIIHPDKRNGAVDTKYRWPARIIFYEIDSIFDEPQIKMIKEAFETIERHTCLRFAPRSKRTKGYILIKGDDTGCHSKVGYHGGEQIVNLHKNPTGVGCFAKIGKVMHEFVHAIGFYHQQSSPDRDDYVIIIRDNIKEGKENQFKKMPSNRATEFGVPYDYDSIMHYGRKAFSKNGKPTILPYSNVEIGQREHLSEADIKKINLMYKCPMY